MDEAIKQYKTLLDEARKPRPRPQWEKDLEQREAKYRERCPYSNEWICSWSKKFRPKGRFPCGGDWFQGCNIYMWAQRVGDDPIKFMEIMNERTQGLRV